MGTLKDRRVKQLEGELGDLREDMRSIVESQQAAMEELQSANEEIVSSNEELQSINEELETTKEEIESSNEELMTVNQELQVRNEQLAEAQEYSEFIYGLIRESVVVLDRDLRVKSANAAFYKTFNLREEDTEEKFLNEVGNNQWSSPQLKTLLMDMVNNGAQFQDFELKDFFPGAGNKVLLLNGKKIIQRTHNNHIYLLAMQDITEFKQPL
jgi:two-component system CheB/CheR fusion protein